MRNADYNMLTRPTHKSGWPALIAASAVTAFALTGCVAYSEVETVTLPLSGKKIDVARHRSDVRFADCGTLNVIQTWDADGKLVDSKEARGGALHCDLAIEALRAGGYIGGAEIIANGAARAAKAAASASNTLEINNANTNNAEGYYSGTQTLNQSQAQTLTGGAGGGSSGTGGTHSGHPNNGFGNGGGDGSPNGHSDNGR